MGKTEYLALNHPFYLIVIRMIRSLILFGLLMASILYVQSRPAEMMFNPPTEIPPTVSLGKNALEYCERNPEINGCKQFVNPVGENG